MKNEIMSLIKKAMLAKDVVKLRVLRLIKTAFTNFETAKNAVVLDEAAELNILKGMVKQRKQSIVEFTEAGRMDLVEQEQEEITILETFLPTMVSEDELKGAILALIQVNKITDMKGMGSVMSALKARYGASFDAGLVNKIFKTQLGL